MRRRRSEMLGVLSFGMLLAVLAFGWAGRTEPVIFGTSDRRDLWWSVGSHLGRLSLARCRRDDPALAGRPGTVGQVGRWGFYFLWSYWEDPAIPGRPKYGSTRCVVVPAWAVTLPLAAPPAIAIRRALRRRHALRRTTRGLCARCGYDLRATPGRCPECGKMTGT